MAGVLNETFERGDSMLKPRSRATLEVAVI